MTYDFSGYATRHNVRCSDGRTILPNAFADCDGQVVPLVWQHVHDSVDNVLGHAELENRPEGVYAYCSLNDTPNGQIAKNIVEHGDICALSIYANRLKQLGENVMHGVIREVSLVLAGANPEARIDNLAFSHGDGFAEDEACMYFIDPSYAVVVHKDEDPEEKTDDEESDEAKAKKPAEAAEDSDKTIGEIIDTMNDEQQAAVYALIGSLVENGELPEDAMKHADEEDKSSESKEKTVKEILEELSPEEQAAVNEILNAVASDAPGVSEETKKTFNGLTEEQKNAVYAVVGSMKDGKAAKHADSEDESSSDETIQDILDTLDDTQKKALNEILAVLSNGKGAVSDEGKKAFESFSDKQKDAVYALVGMAVDDGKGSEEDDSVEHADTSEIEEILNGLDDQQMNAVESILTVIENGEDSIPAEVADVVNGMTEDQQKAVQALIDASLEETNDKDEEPDNKQELEHSIFGGSQMPNHNIFESTSTDDVLTHSDIEAIFAEAPRYGTLKEAILQHGITDIEVLFPEAQAVNNQPYPIQRRMEWVSTVLNGTHKVPFARLKSTAVNLTEEQARAKGYIKGRKKIEEQISALRRVTTPQTIYKLQKLDRDDIIDITDFDVVAFMKQEMRMMLDEEIARAILVGDGRIGTDPEKIFPEHIRPVWTDDEMYTIHQVIPANKATDYDSMIDDVVRSRKQYKGSGNPIMFIGPDVLTEMRLLKDNSTGKFRYESDNALAEALRVSKIEEVELFNDLVRTVEGKDRKLVAIILNMGDYTCGANKGGEVSMFDDFDIDYNKMVYLIETRMSGALTQPKSAIAIEIQTTNTSTPEVKYIEVESPVTSDIADYYEQDEYGRYVKTVDTAVVAGKTYFEIDE